MTDIIQELRGLLAEERKALRDMKESGATKGALLDAWLKASGRLNQASTAALPALLDRLEAAERVIDFLDMRRPINGIERRSKEEVFAIMADRIRLAEAGHYRLPAIREVRP